MSDQKHHGTSNPADGAGRKGFWHRASHDVSGSLLGNQGVEGELAQKVEQKLQLPLMIAAALTLPSVILMETREEGLMLTLSTILNWGTWLVFALDVVLMLILVPRRLQYIKTHPVEIAIVILTPPVVPASFQLLRMLRLLRLLRLLKLAEYSRKAFSTQGLAYAALMTVTVAIVGGSLYRAFESGNQKLDEWEGMYWAVTTMMTVGSDYQTTTTASQVIEVVILIAGVGFISMLTGALAQRFVAPPKNPAAPNGSAPPDDATGSAITDGS